MFVHCAHGKVLMEMMLESASHVVLARLIVLVLDWFTCSLWLVMLHFWKPFGLNKSRVGLIQGSNGC